MDIKTDNDADNADAGVPMASHVPVLRTGPVPDSHGKQVLGSHWERYYLGVGRPLPESYDCCSGVANAGLRSLARCMTTC